MLFLWLAVVFEPQAQMCCSSVTPDSAAHSSGDTLRCKVTHRLTKKIDEKKGEKGSRLQSFWRNTSLLSLQLTAKQKKTRGREKKQPSAKPQPSLDAAFKMYTLICFDFYFYTMRQEINLQGGSQWESHKNVRVNNSPSTILDCTMSVNNSSLISCIFEGT